ncbi:hypothetical protein B0H10DRAFT_2014077 [Mycena sp. CBHHK59/15]|nr:hypothetical protein B0H10DRAFT_2014077 [Mycena sp. CBHHK59/15]
MVVLFLPLYSLFALVSASSPHSNGIVKRDATGDSACTKLMCIAAVLNGSTVQYTMSGTGKRPVGWMGMGFGSQMANAPMVIMWANLDGSITLSQRQASDQVMPSLVSDPPRIATLSPLSSTSGSSSFVFTTSANNDTKQTLIYGFGSTAPYSSDAAAYIQQHIDWGTVELDLTKTFTATTSAVGTTGATPTAATTHSTGARGTPFTPYQQMVVVHAVLSAVGFAVLLPIGALLARYLRTFTPTWYTGHWIVQFGLAGPLIVVGLALGIKAGTEIGVFRWDTHMKTGILLFVLYLLQCGLGAFIHYVKPKNARGRPPQNYAHAVLGLFVLGGGLYQIRDGYATEWPNYTTRGPVPGAVGVAWIVWVILLPVLYGAGLALLRRQYRQEAGYRKAAAGEAYDLGSTE